MRFTVYKTTNLLNGKFYIDGFPSLDAAPSKFICGTSPPFWGKVGSKVAGICRLVGTG